MCGSDQLRRDQRSYNATCKLGFHGDYTMDALSGTRLHKSPYNLLHFGPGVAIIVGSKVPFGCSYELVPSDVDREQQQLCAGHVTSFDG